MSDRRSKRLVSNEFLHTPDSCKNKQHYGKCKIEAWSGLWNDRAGTPAGGHRGPPLRDDSTVGASPRGLPLVLNIRNRPHRRAIGIFKTQGKTGKFKLIAGKICEVCQVLYDDNIFLQQGFVYLVIL